MAFPKSNAKDAEGIANTVNPDQIAPLGVWSASALFAQTCLSENYTNSADPDNMSRNIAECWVPQNAASDQGLHCLHT